MLCGFKPPAMDKRVVIQSRASASDGQGGYTETWTDTATVWASIKPAKGFERYQAMKLETPVTHEVVMRYRAGITTKNRLVYDERIFDLKEVLNLDEANAYLKMMALEVLA
jgi:SPP1 family predicted phage head-tail adaptor